MASLDDLRRVFWATSLGLTSAQAAELTNSELELLYLNAPAGGGGGLTTEEVDDRVNALVIAGANITKTYDDVANTLTLAAGVGAHVHSADDTTTGTFSAFRLPWASSAAKGISELATNAETLTGTDVERVVTPAGLKSVLDAQIINAQIGTAYTLVAADVRKLVTSSNAAAQTMTVPANVFTAGQRVDVLRTGAGSLTLAAGAGMTLNGTPSLVTRAQWSAVTVLFLTATSAVVIGDLATP